MAANVCRIEADGAPVLVAGERVVCVRRCGFQAMSGSGYPGQSSNHNDADCFVFLTNLRLIIRPRQPTQQFSSFVLPMWLVTDEKMVAPRIGLVRIEGLVVAIPGLGLPGRARFSLEFPDRSTADEFMQMLDPVIEKARHCHVLGGDEYVAHHSVCAGPPVADAPAIDYVGLRADRALMDPDDPSILVLPPARAPSPPPVETSDVDVSEPMRLGRPDRSGYQRILDRHP